MYFPKSSDLKVVNEEIDKRVLISKFFVGKSISTENLNDMKTPGTYMQNGTANATSARNYPIAEAGFLEVFVNESRYWTVQRYMTISSKMYVRTCQDNAWGGWVEK